MLASLSIYLLTLALCLAAGVAMGGLLDPRGRWLGVGTPALGAAALVIAAYPLGLLFRGSVVAVLLPAAIALALALAAWQRRGVAGALRVSRGEALTLALGAAMGLVLLAPVLSIGFPTTIGGVIWDGWSRAVSAHWLLDHRLLDSTRGLLFEQRQNGYSGRPSDLAAGFEYLVATVTSLLGRRTFETTLAVATVAGPVALAGWARLHEVITGARPGPWRAAAFVVATLSPLFALPFADNYLTQGFSLALWPFAMAATCEYVRAPAVRTAVPAAIGLGAVAGVYPPLLPWVVPAVLALVFAAAPDLRAGLRGLAGLAVAAAVLAPLQLVRAVHSAVVFSTVLVSNPTFPRFPARQDLGVVLGGVSEYSLPPFGAAPPPAWRLALPALVVLAAAAAGAVALRGMGPRARRPLLALGGAVGAVTAAAYAKYKFGDGYGYGAYKALVSGGTLLAGLLVVALVAAPARLRAVRVAALVACLAVWAPVTVQVLHNQRDGHTGFHAADRGLIQSLGRLPARDVVLVEGSTFDDSAFRTRMMAAYAANTLHRPIDGLGSTPTYFAPGGGAGWRPRRPWRYVVVDDAASPFAAGRRTVWREPPFSVQRAPALDVTPYATARWQTWPAADRIAGPAELVVSNRAPRPADARLELELSAIGAPRSLRLTAPSARAREIRLSVGAPRRAAYRVRVPARATAIVSLDPGTPVRGPDGSAAPLVSLTRVGVS